MKPTSLAGLVVLSIFLCVAAGAGAAQQIVVSGRVITETGQAAPNGFSVHLQPRDGYIVASATPARNTGAFDMEVSGMAPGAILEIVVKDPMARRVPPAAGSSPQATVSAESIANGRLDAGEVRVSLPPQDPVEAFAFGGHVFGPDGKPLADGHEMHVSTANGNRKTSMEIEDGKFALIFIDLQGEFPRIGEGDSFQFSVRDSKGEERPVEPSSYTLTRTDVANSSISTLEFKVGN